MYRKRKIYLPNAYDLSLCKVSQHKLNKYNNHTSISFEAHIRMRVTKYENTQIKLTKLEYRKSKGKLLKFHSY